MRIIMFTEISADVLCLLGLEDNFVISVEGKNHFGENGIGFLEFLLEIQYNFIHVIRNSHKY